MKVHELLATATQWTQGSLARDSDGFSVDPEASRAVKWCLLGAIKRCYPDSQEQMVIGKMVREALVWRGNHITVAQWNDSTYPNFHAVKKLITKLDI